MEFLEMVNIQFAFPVVGVILCAVLVFAFGFKSSVQPPSFESLYEDTNEDIRNKRKSKQKKVKILDDCSSSPNKRSLVKIATSPNSKQTLSCKPDQQECKNKQRKAKPVLISTILCATISSKETKPDEDVVGQWTTVLLKKNKKGEDKKEAIGPVAAGQPLVIELPPTSNQQIDVAKSSDFQTLRGQQCSMKPVSSPKEMSQNRSSDTEVISTADKLVSTTKDSTMKNSVVVEAIKPTPLVTSVVEGTFVKLGESEWQEKTVKKKKKSKKEN